MVDTAPHKRKGPQKTLIQFAYASSAGIAMVLAIFGCLYIGRYLDQQFGTGLIFTIIFLLLGIAGGFRNLIYVINKFSSDEKSDTDGAKSEPDREKPPPEKT